MSVNQKKQIELDNRRRQVAQLYLRKMNQEEIATRLKVHRSTISRDICYLRKKWMKQAMADISIRKARELAELEEMERDCVMQFATTPSTKWIRLRLNIKERIHRLLGLDAPSLAHIEIDWRRELIEAGMTSEEIGDTFESMVQKAYDDLKTGNTENDNRGNKGGEEKA